MEDFVIKKVKVEIDIIPLFSDKLTGFLFLPEASRFHQGRETLYEYMNSADEFIAFKNENGLHFFKKSSIKMITIKNKEEEEALYTNVVYKEENCNIRFIDGDRIECKIRFDPNTFHNRIYDFLNHSPTFINGLINDELILLNKNCIIEIKLKG